MRCLLADLIERARAPRVQAALRTMLDRTEEQLSRLTGLLCPRAGETEDRCAGKGHLETERRLPGSLRDVGFLVRAREMAELACSGYGWAHSLADRLWRPAEGRLLRLSLEEKKDAPMDLTRLAAELLPDHGVWGLSRRLA